MCSFVATFADCLVQALDMAKVKRTPRTHRGKRSPAPPEEPAPPAEPAPPVEAAEAAGAAGAAFKPIESSEEAEDLMNSLCDGSALKEEDVVADACEIVAESAGKETPLRVFGSLSEHDDKIVFTVASECNCFFFV